MLVKYPFITKTKTKFCIGNVSDVMNMKSISKHFFFYKIY